MLLQQVEEASQGGRKKFMIPRERDEGNLGANLGGVLPSHWKMLLPWAPFADLDFCGVRTEVDRQLTCEASAFLVPNSYLSSSRSILLPPRDIVSYASAFLWPTCSRAVSLKLGFFLAMLETTSLTSRHWTWCANEGANRARTPGDGQVVDDSLG